VDNSLICFFKIGESFLLTNFFAFFFLDGFSTGESETRSSASSSHLHYSIPFSTARHTTHFQGKKMVGFENSSEISSEHLNDFLFVALTPSIIVGDVETNFSLIKLDIAKVPPD